MEKTHGSNMQQPTAATCIAHFCATRAPCVLGRIKMRQKAGWIAKQTAWCVVFVWHGRFSTMTIVHADDDDDDDPMLEIVWLESN